MRDFAVYATPPPNQAVLPSEAQPTRIDAAAPRSFWSRYIRIDIEEDESRDHLGENRPSKRRHTHHWQLKS
jgi:hypothetical protein